MKDRKVELEFSDSDLEKVRIGGEGDFLKQYPGQWNVKPLPHTETTPHTAFSAPIQMSAQELTTCVSNAIATGLEKAITGVLKSPELSSFIEGLTRSKGILGVLQGLATHSGRNALDARTMDQNAMEIYHLMDKAIEATKSRLQERASGVELDPEIKDAEKDFQEYLARLENDKGIS